jgi:hypothetical protein
MTTSVASGNKRRNLQSPRLASANMLYSSEEVIKLYEISRNTLTNWISDGLQFIAAEPRLFLGACLNEYHRQRRHRASQPLGRFETSCYACKQRHSLIEGELVVVPGKTAGLFKVARLCPQTGKHANRYVTGEQLDEIYGLRQSNPGSQTPD